LFTLCHRGNRSFSLSFFFFISTTKTTSTPCSVFGGHYSWSSVSIQRQCLDCCKSRSLECRLGFENPDDWLYGDLIEIQLPERFKEIDSSVSSIRR
jgi:hypothetical protein